MYCERCNVEFTDGLRYCKWCGQALTDRPRVTSELHACPNCAAAVQPGWIFCKSCGVRLAAPVSDPGRIFCPKCGAGSEAAAASCARCGTSLTTEPARPSPTGHSTAVIGGCSSCGEKLDTGSMYCKACGAAVYAQARPFGGSALLCAACNSYSPIGSTACRVCGAKLRADTESATAIIDQQKPTTLPDLPGRLTHADDLERFESEQEESGANTAIFSAPGQGADPTSALAGGDRDTGLVGERAGGQGTNALPGVAGSKSEFSAQTKRVPKTRITSPVEDDAPPERPGSAELPTGEPETALINSPPFAATVESPGVPAESSHGSADTAFVSSEPAPRTASSFSTREHVSTIPFAEGRPVSDIPATPDIGTLSPGAPLDQPQPQPKKRNGVAIASAVVALIILGGVGYLLWWFVFQKGSPPPPPIPVQQKPPDTPAPPPAAPPPVIPAGMVMVKAGTYSIGREDGDPMEGPGHQVTLGAYYIDRTEVTNADYAKFVEATRHEPPSNWKGASIPAGKDDFPVTGVSWQDAADYAAWAGKRLPTEAEWEAAARGSDARKYPWGNGWQSGFANIGLRTAEKVEATRYPSGISEVGTYPQGVSPSGALDMIGNAWEWVADEISLYPGSSATLPTPADDAAGALRVIRGGAYDGDKKHDASYRGFLDGNLPYPKVGFRCVKSAGQ